MPNEFEDNIEDNKKENEENKPKTHTVPLFFAVIFALLLSVLTFQITYIVQSQKYNKLISEIYVDSVGGKLLSEIDEIYSEYYVGDIDKMKLNDGVLMGYVYGTGDKYGNYLNPEDYNEYKELHQNNSAGIGIIIISGNEGEAIEVLRVYKDSPASKAGLVPGDLIVSVDGKSVKDIGYTVASDNLIGDIGTRVDLTVNRDGQTLQIEVTRGNYTVETVEYKMLQNNVGYVKITNFYGQTPTEFKNAVNALLEQNAEGIVFDLRGNGGGLLTSVTEILDFLLPEGVVVRISDSSGKFRTMNSDASCIDIPMTVIVNGSSASGAELFTSALMDYDKATVIGTQTYGKGTVTTPFALSNGGYVYVSNELYYPPISDNFEGVGITPDIVLELEEEYKNVNLYKLTYEQDAQLRKAVEILNKQ